MLGSTQPKRVEEHLLFDKSFAILLRSLLPEYCSNLLLLQNINSELLGKLSSASDNSIGGEHEELITG